MPGSSARLQRFLTTFLMVGLTLGGVRMPLALADQMVFQRQVSPSSGYTNMYEPSSRIYTYTTSSTPGNPSATYLHTSREVAYFDLSSLPAGATITQAVFKNYCSAALQGPIFIYRTRTNWLSGASWSNAGGDWADASGVEQGTAPYATWNSTTTGWFTWDVTPLVQGWYTGAFPNYGLFIMASTSASGSATFRGSGYGTTTLRPILEVTYTLGGGDTTPPTVSLSAPAAGATVAGSSVTVSATASDNVGVAGVQFKLDGANLGAEDTTSPYSFTWNTTTATNGSHSLTAVARDAAANSTTSAAVSVTVDNAAPVISSGPSASNITSTGATITWTTNEASTSQVDYGLTTGYGSQTTPDSSLVTNHSVGLSGLAASTLYHYRVRSVDAAGNERIGTDVTFTTQAAADTTPPTISGVSSSNVTATGATITWTTNEAATSQVEYGATTSYGSLTTLDTNLITSHSVGLSGLSASTLYHYRVLSKDAANNAAQSSDLTFTTSAAADTTPPSGTITVNNNAAATNSTAVTLTLSASDPGGGTVTGMQFANEVGAFSPEETYATNRPNWPLSTGEGQKTVSVKFKDAAGNWSSPVSDTIALDTTPPTISFTSPQDGATLNAPAP